jgi:hypothetical protein
MSNLPNFGLEKTPGFFQDQNFKQLEDFGSEKRGCPFFGVDRKY